MRVYGVPFECLKTEWYSSDCNGLTVTAEICHVDFGVIDQVYSQAITYGNRNGYPIPGSAFPRRKFVVEDPAPPSSERAYIAINNDDGMMRVEEFHDLKNAYSWLAAWHPAGGCECR